MIIEEGRNAKRQICIGDRVVIKFSSRRMDLPCGSTGRVIGTHRFADALTTVVGLDEGIVDDDPRVRLIPESDDAFHWAWGDSCWCLIRDPQPDDRVFDPHGRLGLIRGMEIPTKPTETKVRVVWAENILQFEDSMRGVDASQRMSRAEFRKFQDHVQRRIDALTTAVALSAMTWDDPTDTWFVKPTLN